jgi:methylmalonyl-CoA mutase
MFSTPEEVVEQAIDNDVHVIGVSSQAAGHKSLVPQLMAALRARSADDIIVVVGGVIPKQDVAFLEDAGVKAVFGPGTRVPLAARTILEEIAKTTES